MGKILDFNHEDIDFKTLSADLTTCKTKLVTLHTIAETQNSKIERFKAERKKKVNEIKRYQAMLIDLEEWLGEAQGTIRTDIRLTTVKIVRDQIRASEALAEELQSRSHQLENMIRDMEQFTVYPDVEPLVADMKDNLGSLQSVMKKTQECLMNRLKNLQDALAQINSKSEISAPDIDIDTETTSENLEIEDESLKTVDIDFSSKDEESFKIQPPSIEFNTESIHKTLGDKINSEEIEYSVQYFGNLHVSVSNAKDLEKKDFFQKADPYVVISLGSQTFKSQKVKNNLNPEWNHEVTFSLDQHSLEDINIIIYDWDRFGKDDPMGNAILDLHYAIKKSNKGVFCLPLENCKSGQIFISTRFDGETRKKQVTLKGVTDLKKYLSDNTELDNKTINAEGKEETIEEIIEKPEVDDESKIIEKVSLPTIEVDDGTEVEEIKIEIVEGDEEISTNDGWTKIPIILLDNNQVSQSVEIEELSDEDQEEPIDLTNKLQVEGVVSTPSDEEFSQESTNILELDDEPLDLSKKHKPLSNESSISSTSSSVITVIGNDNKPKLADDCDESPKWSVNIPIIRNLGDKDKASSKEYDGDVRVGAVNIPIIRVQNEAEKSKEKKEIIDEESFSEGNKEPPRPDNVS